MGKKGFEPLVGLTLRRFDAEGERRTPTDTDPLSQPRCALLPKLVAAPPSRPGASASLVASWQVDETAVA